MKPKRQILIFLIVFMALVSLFTMAITVKCDDEVPVDEAAEVVEVEPQKSWLTTQLETNVFPFIFSLLGGGTGAGVIAAVVAKALTNRKKESEKAEKLANAAKNALEKKFDELTEEYAKELDQVKALVAEFIQAKDVIVSSVEAIKEGEKTIEDFKKDIIEQIAIVSKGTEYTMTMLVELACSKAELVEEGKARLVAQQKELYEKYLADCGIESDGNDEQNQL